MPHEFLRSSTEEFWGLTFLYEFLFQESLFELLLTPILISTKDRYSTSLHLSLISWSAPLYLSFMTLPLFWVSSLSTFQSLTHFIYNWLCFQIKIGSVSWFSKNQSTIILSSSDADYVTCCLGSDMFETVTQSSWLCATRNFSNLRGQSSLH
jgi:hypothetical protein